MPRSESGGFEDWPALDELFPAAYQGVNPNRGLDGSLIEIDKRTLEATNARVLLGRRRGRNSSVGIP